MAKLVWTPGTPTVRGIYWFDTGMRFGWEKKKDQHPFVIQVSEGDSWENIHLFGDYGSGSLSMYYSPKMCPTASWAHIEQPEEWGDHTVIKGERGRAWVKHPKGYLGFGLLKPGWHSDLGGTIVWLDNPNEASVSGGWWKSSEGYKFSAVKLPKVKK